MADTGTLGSLVISLEANLAKFTDDMGKAEQIMAQSMARIDSMSAGLASTLKGVGLAMAGLGAGIGLSVLQDKFHSITESLANLKEMSEKTGATVENLSALAGVAKIAGTDLGAVEQALIKLDKALAGADDSAKGAGHALEYLGLSGQKMRGGDAAESMLQIALQIEKVRDGSSRAALAMDIFGKQGAQLLPYLHDLATTGALVAKTTTDQAEAAKEYEQDIKRLTLSKDALYKTLTVSAIPAMDSFVKVLIEAKNNTNSLQKAAKGLSEDGSITSWAETMGMGAAHALDIFVNLKNAASDIGIAVERLCENFFALGASIRIAISSPFKDMGSDLATLKSHMELIYHNLDERVKKNATGTSNFAERYRKQLSGDKEEKAQKRQDDIDAMLDDGMYGNAPYTSRAQKDGKNEVESPYSKYLDELDRMLIKTNENTYAAMRLKAATLAGNNDKSAEAIQRINQLQIDESTRNADLFKVSMDKVTQGYQDQIALVGMSTREQQLYTEALKIRRAAQDDIDAAVKAGKPLTASAIDKINADMKTATDAVIQSVEERRAAESKWENGAAAGLKNYADTVANVAKSTETMVTSAFKGMEDALVNFVKTGKLDFKSLADSIVTDLIRIQVQKSVTGPLSKAIDSSGGFGGIASSVGSFFSNMLPSFAVGTDYVPQDMIAQIHQGERIVPASQNTGGSGQPVNINFQVSTMDAASFRQTLAANKNTIIGVVRDAFTKQAITSPI